MAATSVARFLCRRTRGGLLIAAFAAALSGCTGHGADTDALTVPVKQGPLRLVVHARGDAYAVTSTGIQVPGTNFSSRTLTWILDDGSRVHKGEVVARFSVTSSRDALAQDRLDLARNTLAVRGKQADLAAKRGKLDVDLADVATQLAIARRYASAGNEAFARDTILDAIQDKAYLGTRQHILQWQRAQAHAQGEAELGVLQAKRATLQLKAKQKQGDIDARVVRAPHDGVLRLKRNWAGQLPQVGGTYWASQSLASLPDLSQLEVRLAVPQLEAQSIAVGDTVRLHPLGLPTQSARTKVSAVSSAAQVLSDDSPVKYIMVTARLPVDAARRWNWLPGQPFRGTIVLLDSHRTLSVPNLAVASDGDHARVTVLDGGKVRERIVTLGVRGPSRTQILSGLRAGERVVIDPGTQGGS